MKKLVTPFRVGLLVVVSTGFLFLFLTFVRKGGMSDRESAVYYAYFRDASGLSQKSRIQIAGIAVGEVASVVLEGSRAKVYVRIRRDVPIHIDAAITKRSESILGDFLIDLNPGSDSAPLLEDKGQITRVIDAQGMEAVFDSLSKITSDINQVTMALRDSLGGQKGAASLQSIVDNMVRLSGAVDETVARSSAQLESILRNVDRVSSDVRGLSSSQQDNVRTILENLRQITTDARDVAQSVRVAVSASDGGLADTGQTVQGTLRSLNQTLDNLETVTQAIRDGKGTAGQLLSNERLGQKVGDTIEGVSDLASRITELKTEVSVRTEYLFAQQAAKTFVGLRLIPKPDKYYLLELIDDPRKSITTTVVQTNPPATGQPSTQVQRVTSTSLKISAELAKRYYFVTLRFGLIESTGGFGGDLQFFDDKLTFKFDLFDIGDSNFPYPRLRAAIRYSPINHVFASFGMDDILNNRIRDNVTHDLLGGRDFFLGAGVYFNDDDLKSILVVAPKPNF